MKSDECDCIQMIGVDKDGDQICKKFKKLGLCCPYTTRGARLLCPSYYKKEKVNKL